MVKYEEAKSNLLGSTAAQELQLLRVQYENFKTKNDDVNQISEKYNMGTSDELGLTMQATTTEFSDVFETLVPPALRSRRISLIGSCRPRQEGFLKPRDNI